MITRRVSGLDPIWRRTEGDGLGDVRGRPHGLDTLPIRFDSFFNLVLTQLSILVLVNCRQTPGSVALITGLVALRQCHALALKIFFAASSLPAAASSAAALSAPAASGLSLPVFCALAPAPIQQRESALSRVRLQGTSQFAPFFESAEGRRARRHAQLRHWRNIANLKH